MRVTLAALGSKSAVRGIASQPGPVPPSSHSLAPNPQGSSEQPSQYGGHEHHGDLVFSRVLRPFPLILLGHGKQWLVKCDDWCLTRMAGTGER